MPLVVSWFGFGYLGVLAALREMHSVDRDNSRQGAKPQRKTRKVGQYSVI